MQNSEGWSALIKASQKGHTAIASLLLQDGGKVNLQADNKMTSLMIVI